MKDGLRFVDSDMHVMEPPDIFERYLDPKFKDRVTVKVGADGRPARGPGWRRTGRADDGRSAAIRPSPWPR